MPPHIMRTIARRRYASEGLTRNMHLRDDEIAEIGLLLGRQMTARERDEAEYGRIPVAVCAPDGLLSGLVDGAFACLPNTSKAPDYNEGSTTPT